MVSRPTCVTKEFRTKPALQEDFAPILRPNWVSHQLWAQTVLQKGFAPNLCYLVLNGWKFLGRNASPGVRFSRFSDDHRPPAMIGPGNRRNRAQMHETKKTAQETRETAHRPTKTNRKQTKPRTGRRSHRGNGRNRAQAAEVAEETDKTAQAHEIARETDETRTDR